MLGIVVLLAAVLLAGILAWLYRRARRRPAAPRRVSLAFTPHAQQRMRERDVAAEQVFFAVTRPDRAVPTDYADFGAFGGPQLKDSMRLEREIDGRILKVWVPVPWPPAREVVVKSVAWSDFAETVRVPARSVGRVIGRSGTTIRGIEHTTGASISHLGDGVFRITADEPRAIARAKQAIRAAAR